MKKMIPIYLLGAVFLAFGCANQNLTSYPKPPEKSLNLQALIEKAPDDSTVIIPFGEYRLSKGLVIKGRKNLVITTEPGTRILVQDPDADVLSIQRSKGIRIENLYLRHIKPLEEYECHGEVLRIKNSEDVKIINCELNGCGAIGVAGYNSKNIIVRNCFIHHNSFNAFYFQGCGKVLIQSSIIEDNANSIQIYDTKSLEMRDNILRRNGGYWSASDPNPGLKKNIEE